MEHDVCVFVERIQKRCVSDSAGTMVSLPTESCQQHTKLRRLEPDSAILHSDPSDPGRPPNPEKKEVTVLASHGASRGCCSKQVVFVFFGKNHRNSGFFGQKRLNPLESLPTTICFKWL